jgi:large subunit ribosomal protein L17
MRHRIKGKKLNRDGSHRKALRLNLSMALLQHGRIQTTLAKAQFVRGHTEKLITVAKRGLADQETKGVAAGVHARRIAASRLNNDRELVQKLFDRIAPQYAERPGGYTRILKLGPRRGDNAEMALIELVDYDPEFGA